MSPNFGCKILRYTKWLNKDLKSVGADGWFRFAGFKDLAKRTIVDARCECSNIFWVVVIRKVRHSVLNTSISTEVAIYFFNSLAMASSICDLLASRYFCKK